MQQGKSDVDVLEIRRDKLGYKRRIGERLRWVTGFRTNEPLVSIIVVNDTCLRAMINIILLTAVAFQDSGCRMFISISRATNGMSGSLGAFGLVYSSFRAIAVRTKARLLDLPRKCVCFVSRLMFLNRSITASLLSRSSSITSATPGANWPDGCRTGVD